MHQDPAVAVHELAAELGRAAEALLDARHGISYARYRVLRAIRRGDGAATQHALAVQLGVGDAGLSRMLPALTERGWCVVADDPEHGRRRTVDLTAAGARLEGQCAELLAEAFHGAASDAGVDPDSFVDAVEALTAQLRSSVSSPSGSSGTE